MYWQSMSFSKDAEPAWLLMVLQPSKIASKLSPGSSFWGRKKLVLATLSLAFWLPPELSWLREAEGPSYSHFTGPLLIFSVSWSLFPSYYYPSIFMWSIKSLRLLIQIYWCAVYLFSVQPIRWPKKISFPKNNTTGNITIDFFALQSLNFQLNCR